jgi:Kef-type K+ transport system membrane component KefB
MSFEVLALICAVALIGPLLSLPRFRLPVVIGELLVGIALGQTGARVLDSTNETLAFLGEVGFAMVMFVAGTHVPVRNRAMLGGLGRGLGRAAAIGVLSVPTGLLLAHLFNNDHGWLYAVLLASSSASLVMPALGGRVSSRAGLEVLPQLAAADAACIVALPLAIDPAHAGRAALGGLAVLGTAAAYFAFLRWAEVTGRRRAVHEVSERKELTIELRVVLLMLFGLAAIAVATHVSVMLAGFAMGLVVSAVGEPKRIAHQMLALTEGFFAPIFFVWLGSSLDLRALAGHPEAIWLGVSLGLAALVVHGAMVVTRQPVALALATAAQLGVPVGAAALGTQLGILGPGEPTALLLGAMITVLAVAVLAPRMQSDATDRAAASSRAKASPEASSTP